MKNIKTILLLMPFLVIGCSTPTLEESYKSAIKEAMMNKEENIRKLVNINKEDSNVKWNDKGEVLMTTLHRYPDSYKEGETITINWEAWVISTKEFSNVYKDCKNTFTNDPSLRVKQLFGMGYESKNTHLASYWVNPNDLIRPAYVININKPMQTSFPEDISEDYKTWFYNQCGYAYYSNNPTPWTRLGYTYDWALNNKDKYGLSEFLIKKERKANVTVEKNTTIKDFLTYLETV